MADGVGAISKKKKKKLVIGYNKDIDRDIRYSLDVLIYGVEDILDGYDIVYHVEVGVDLGKMHTVNYSHRGYESARIPLQAWLGDFKLLKIEIFQVNYPAADIGTSNGNTILGRTQVPVPEDFFKRFRHRVEVVKMVRGVLKKIGTIDVEVQKRRIDVEFEREMTRKKNEEKLEQKCRRIEMEREWQRRIEMEREQRRIEMEQEIKRLMEMEVGGRRRGVSMFDNVPVYYQLQQVRSLITSLYNLEAARQLTSDIDEFSDSDSEPLAASSPSEPTAQRADNMDIDDDDDDDDNGNVNHVHYNLPPDLARRFQPREESRKEKPDHILHLRPAPANRFQPSGKSKPE